VRIIALEEAFLHPSLRELYPAPYVKLLDRVKANLTDVGSGRIRRMDAAGIDLQVLSHVQPGVQTLDQDTAIRLSKEVNDWLDRMVQEHPTRFAGFAMLPTQSPGHAADELERTVAELGFKGALINGHTHGLYLDDASFSPIFDRAQKLGVPIYIHPADPPPEIIRRRVRSRLPSWASTIYCFQSMTRSGIISRPLTFYSQIGNGARTAVVLPRLGTPASVAEIQPQQVIDESEPRRRQTGAGDGEVRQFGPHAAAASAPG
jgi:Amidohydrolase